MKRQLFAPILTATVLALGAIPTVSQHSQAQERPTYFCDRSNNFPATVARTSWGNIVLIQWVSTDFLPLWPPQRRCQAVSARYQTYHENGMLNHLSSGIVNRLPVVCVARTPNGPCEGVLFTLKRGSDPNGAIERLYRMRDAASVAPTDVELGIGVDVESPDKEPPEGDGEPNLVL